MTFNPSGNTYGTGSADLYDKYDADIKAGTATLNNYKGWVNFWIGLSPTSGITYDVTDVKITTYTNTASSSGSHLLDYEEMTVDPFTASRSEIRNDIGSNTEYTFSTAGQQVGFYITSLGSVAISKIESIFNSGPGYFPVGFEEYNMDDNRCIIDGRFDNNPPILKVTYYRIPAAPTGVSASDGTYCDYVYITWNSVGSASSYDVYRGSTNLGNTTSTYYYDYNASTSSTTYKVYAKTDCGTSTSYGSDNGYKKSSCTPPSSASASSSTICSGGSTTLSVSPSSPGSGCTWKWYSGSCGGTYVGSGNNLQVSPTSTTTYYVRAEGSCDPTICKSVIVTVQPSCTPPSSASASSSTICSGESTTLSVSPSSPGSGCTWKWYSGSCGGTYVGSGNNLQVSPTSTTTYYVRAEGSCDPTICKSVIVTVQPSCTPPSSASASSSTICSGESTTLSVSPSSPGSGCTWKWYSGSCGGTYVGSGNNLQVSPTSTTTYYVRAEGSCDPTICKSVIVTVQPSCTPPSSASASSSTICSGESTTLSVSPSSPGSGCTWKWYSGSCGGTYVGSGNNLQVSPTSTTTYYVRAEGSCDPTICKSVIVTVQPSCTPPSSASASSSTICSGESTTLSVSPSSPGSGCTWKWYSGSCGGTYVGSGNNLQVSPTSTTTYYVRAEGSCDPTICKSVTVTVQPSCTPPSSASASPSTIYFGEYTTLSVSPSSPGSGCTWKWYSGSCGGTYVGSGNNLQVSPTSTTTYYVRAEGSCDPTYCENVTVFVDAPTISLNPPDHDFGNININEYSYEFSFTLKNIGTGTAEGNVSLTGSNTDQFEISSGSGSFSLAANATKTINVKFHPNLEGYKSANLLADGSNCNDVSASVSGNGVTAIDDAVLLKYIINIYPNPAFDKLNIEFTDNINKIEELTLYDMLGQAVYLINGKNINTTNFVIDLSEYKSGIYYLNIQTKEDGIIRNKIIIVR